MKVYICKAAAQIEVVTLDQDEAETWLLQWSQHYDGNDYYFPIPLPTGGSQEGGRIVAGFRSGTDRYLVLEYGVSLQL